MRLTRVASAHPCFPKLLLVAYGVGIGPAVAAPPQGEAKGRIGATNGGLESDDGQAQRDKREPLSKRRDKKWIHRWAPERNMVELGIYGGGLVPAADTELFEPNLTLPQQGFRRFERLAPTFGGRFGYYPIRFLGLEVEGGAAPTEILETGRDAMLWTARGHVVAQLGLWSITPFVLVGGGVLSVASVRQAVGNDIDQMLHFGGGVKFYFNRWFQARLDFRDVVTPRRGANAGPTNNLEALLGFSLTFGRDRDRDRPADSDGDGDGFPDKSDKCPRERGVAPDGCPTKDGDNDGIIDTNDKCPTEPGIAPDGCPDPDLDRDGIALPDDICPTEAGIAPDGCPDPDPDHDGISGPDDQCPTEAETTNGYKDSDGCPDTLPDDVGGFQGTLQGVQFNLSEATLRPESKPTLDQAVEILNKYPDLRIEISGHSDSTGSRDLNMKLSSERAGAVKKHLTQQGIAGARIETRGAGPDEPIDSNQTKAGQARNRRIEFRVLK